MSVLRGILQARVSVRVSWVLAVAVPLVGLFITIGAADHPPSLPRQVVMYVGVVMFLAGVAGLLAVSYRATCRRLESTIRRLRTRPSSN